MKTTVTLTQDFVVTHATPKELKALVKSLKTEGVEVLDIAQGVDVKIKKAKVTVPESGN